MASETVTATEEELAQAICGWHCMHPSQPSPCQRAKTEAKATFTFLSGRLRDRKCRGGHACEKAGLARCAPCKVGQCVSCTSQTEPVHELCEVT